MRIHLPSVSQSPSVSDPVLVLFQGRVRCPTVLQQLRICIFGVHVGHGDVIGWVSFAKSFSAGHLSVLGLDCCCLDIVLACLVFTDQVVGQDGCQQQEEEDYQDWDKNRPDVSRSGNLWCPRRCCSGDIFAPPARASWSDPRDPIHNREVITVH